MTTQRRFPILRVTLAYTLLGMGWMCLSNWLLAHVAPVGPVIWLFVAGDVVFVLVTAVLLNLTWRAVARRLDDPLAAPTGAPAHRTTRLTWAYAVAILTSLPMLLINDQLTRHFMPHGALILFVFPIAVSAYLGGLGPGLAATVLCAGLLDNLSLEPGSNQESLSIDILRRLVLLILGTLLSVLMEQLHRATRRADESRESLAVTAQQLREGQTQLRIALRAARAATWQADFTTGVFHWSEELWPLFGLAPYSRKPGYDAWLETVHPADRSRIETNLGHPERLGEEFELEWRVKGPDLDAPRWLISRGTVVRGDDGSPAQYFGVVFDITRIKRVEAEVHRLNADLEQRVADRTAALSAANEELESFAYAVSHDLRTPLRALMGMAAALREDHGEALPDSARHYLVAIDSAAQRMSGLVGGLLALSRDSLQPLQDDAVDLSSIAAEQLEELARGEPQRAVSLDIQPGIQARGDQRLLSAVVQNLVGNAWKYTARTPEARIRVHASLHDGQPWFCVSDNGTGFDAKQAGSLFRPFQRLHTQEDFPGIGIGLATVRRIVQRHGGRVDAEGVAGQGATFRFTLPGLTSRTASTGRETP